MIKRDSAVRKRHRKIIARNKPPCGICGDPIDYTLPYLHPFEFVVDHIVALAKGGTDTLPNKQAAHRSCNRAKGSGTGDQIVKRSGSLAR